MSYVWDIKYPLNFNTMYLKNKETAIKKFRSYQYNSFTYWTSFFPITASASES